MTTLRPLMVQLSGSLARGVRLLDQFLHDGADAPKDIGRCMMAWVLQYLEPENDADAPPRLQLGLEAGLAPQG